MIKTRSNSLAAVPPAMRADAAREADMDLLARLSAGSIVYPVMLLLIGLATPYRADHPYLFWPVVLTVAVAVAIRVAVHLLRNPIYARGRTAFTVPLLASIFLSGCALGFLLLTVSMEYGFSSWTFTITMLWMAGVASGSTVSFTPSFPLLLVQLLTLLVPGIAYELLLGTTEGLGLGLATLVFLAFHVIQGSRLNAMYWDLSSIRALETRRIRELEEAKLTAEQAQAQLQYQATHDLLTGVLNHARILSLFDHELERAIRSRVPICIVMLDLDHFKQVNEGFGHLGGDEVLRTVAALVRNTIRKYDSVGRYGGEEFLILLPGCGLEESVASAERIRQAIEGKPVSHENSSIWVTASLGVALIDPETDSDHRPMIARADKALYKAKRNGRNRVEVAQRKSDPVPIN
jgi:diguanylate cyclase (GGDEF)-like protein